MKRQLTSILLFSALLVGGASTFVSCTDHESDSAYDTSVSQIAKLTELNKWLGELKETNPDLKTAIDARIQANMDVIKDGVYADKERFEAAIQGSEAYKNLKGKVDGVDGRLQAIEKLRLTDSIAAKKITDALNNRLDSVSGSLDKALNSLVEQKLDGITVNATENPVTGYWNASFLGLNLKLASSFYGVAAEGNEDWDVKANQVLGKGGNAGYLYVSLNPTEIDPSLVKVELVNSQGEPAKGFKLGDIDNTDKVLTFGTKAATVSANGFYQVPVIASDPQNDGVEFDKGALAAAAKNALNELRNPKENDLDLSMIASALYKNIPVLTAYGVKAEYYLYNPNTETLELTKTVKHAVSDYDIAAFAVKPVSYNFLKDNATLDKLSDWAVENFRLPSLSSKLDKVIDALNVEISYDKADEFYTYSVITPNGLFCQQDGNDVVIYGQGTDLNNGQLIDGELYRIKNATVEKKFVSTGGSAAEFVFVIKTKDSTIADLLASANKQIAGKLQPIKNVLSNVNAKWENVIAKVNPLLSKVASKIGSANKLLQPTILYVDQNGNPNTLSTIGGRLGTRFVGTGATTLYATSWTAELLAPAYKKSISVLEKGATVTLTNGKSAAEPFDGSVNKVIFNAEKAGTYTIVYKAIDYSGVEVEKTFNVVVE
ncbi:DUF5011 domain-containing protein [Prevotella copri]|uniref:DUF5011 domain-containing protein n=1 Tax=Segatella copri TaxID=165179 RepID=A0AAW5IMP2_9BACT|nr:DUF5011 domain-containing protein [Segatella copri]MCP9535872.1 DUF5011 domain-containing protein [Segatella copri]MCP9538788.1 DUF5011 domain-containing protein [Segatella copri]MCP9541729.1 DUF5011 domain-containing protein [Segatella copri]MCP9560034.1 DUF5011 domain-containing protein [Segatella copri]MCP9562885.1 DUF5011 domain-containing protein [Segatella copri]